MTIDEAVSILQFMIDQGEGNFYQGDCTAMKLGIKALRRFDELRADGTYLGMPVLKGELETKKDTKYVKGRLPSESV